MKRHSDAGERLAFINSTTEIVGRDCMNCLNRNNWDSLLRILRFETSTLPYRSVAGLPWCHGRYALREQHVVKHQLPSHVFESNGIVEATYSFVSA